MNNYQTRLSLLKKINLFLISNRSFHSSFFWALKTDEFIFHFTYFRFIYSQKFCHSYKVSYFNNLADFIS
jgi:hypothetical protein